MAPRVRVLLVALLSIATAAIASRISVQAQDAAQRAAPATAAPVSFNREILPILSNNCFACHGPDEKARKTRFHFDSKDAAFIKDGVIVPGHAQDSLLVQHITSTDPEERMPPPDSGRSLTDKQIDLLKRWIDQGANWDTHWAYIPPKRAEPPAISRMDWARTPIDRFIAARLEREGLAPSPEADPETLLRRVTYDLTGLPPTPAEVDSFLADRSPDAYERRVDALLQSPHYGERMAMPWLDASRYADTHGYHIDSLREMWPWRDWVIEAFNRNERFDQFVIEQLAGDELPNATREQKIASGFNRNHMINFEGGAIADEYRVEYVIDRVEATSSAFMGLTMGCARCHTHKYDPITQREFYQFFAFFNSVPEQGLDGRTGNAAPLMLLPSHDQQVRLESLDAAIAGKQAALTDAIVAPLQKAWEDTVATDAASATVAAVDGDGLVAHYELDGNFSDISGHHLQGRTVTGEPTFDGGQIGRAVSFDGDTEVSFGNPAPLDRADRFSLAVWLKGRGKLPDNVLQKLDDAAASPRAGLASRRHSAGRDPAVGGPADGHAGLRSAHQRNPAAHARPADTGGLVSRRTDLRRLGQGRRAAAVRERRPGGHRGRQGFADRSGRHHRAAPRGQPRSGLAVRRTARRPAALRSRPQPGGNRPARHATTPCASCSRACSGSARKTTPQSCATTSSRTRRRSPCVPTRRS